MSFLDPWCCTSWENNFFLWYLVVSWNVHRLPRGFRSHLMDCLWTFSRSKYSCQSCTQYSGYGRRNTVNEGNSTGWFLELITLQSWKRALKVTRAISHYVLGLRFARSILSRSLTPSFVCTSVNSPSKPSFRVVCVTPSPTNQTHFVMLSSIVLKIGVNPNPVWWLPNLFALMLGYHNLALESFHNCCPVQWMTPC